jgi:hypothetical protein
VPDFEGNGPVWIREVKLMSLATSVNSSIALHNLALRMKAVKPYRDEYWEALGRYLAPQSIKRTRRDLVDHYHAFRCVAAKISEALSVEVLRKYWEKNQVPFLNSKPEPAESSQLQLAAPEPAERHSMAVAGTSKTYEVNAPAAEPVTREAYELASKYVVFQYQAFIAYALRHLQNILMCCVIGFALLVLALSSFSFQTPQSISRFLMVALFVGGIVVTRVLAQIEKDPILSRMSGTGEGELGRDFYMRLLAYGALPTLTVLGTQFPAVAQFINSWAQPTLSAMK